LARPDGQRIRDRKGVAGYAFLIGAVALVAFVVSRLPGGEGAVLAPLLAGLLVSIATGGVAYAIRQFLAWIERGQRERRMGQVGFVLLLVGFVFQGVVNFLK